MNRLPIRSLIALNILTLILACVIVLAGNKCAGIQQPPDSLTSKDFDDRLAAKIGETYTPKVHSTVTELIQVSFEEAENTYGVLHGYGYLGILVGGLGIVASGISLLTLSRVLLRNKKEAESGPQE